MNSIGELTFILGLQVKQKDDGIFISQDKYMADILKKFASRLDIMIDVCACARFQATPKTSHLHAVKRIFRYLKGQPKLGLWYPRDSPFDLEAFSDSDYAGASLDWKSTTGEYVSAASCCGQVLWIQNQMLDYGFNLMNTNIYIDNKNMSPSRRDLRLDDVEGTTCLPNAAIFEEVARMGICIKLSDKVLSLEQIKTNHAAEIEKLKKRVKKLKGKKKKRTHGLNRLYKVGLTARIKSFEEEEGLGDQEDTSKQRIAEIDVDKHLSLINKTVQDQWRMNDEDLFRVNNLDGDKVIVDVTTGENVEHDATITADKVVTTAKSVKGITAATTLEISKDDVTVAQTLMDIKAAKPRARGAIVQEASKFRTTSSLQPSQLPHAKDKVKGIMVEPKKPLKKKDQIAFDEEVVRKLDVHMKAEMEEEERIAREKDRANIAVIKEWDDGQATFDVDRQRKYFAAKRAKEIRNKPPTKAQQKSLMCTYIKNMEGYKQKDFKGKNFDVIKKTFDKVYKRINTFVAIDLEVMEGSKKTQEYKRINTFVAMDSEVMEGSKKTQAELTEGSSKRIGDEIEQESSKRQRLEKADDTAKLKRCFEIVFEDDDDVTIEATPLSSKSPTIVDYKIYKEGKKSYLKSSGQIETQKTI
nr:hypothetical protein [Tanacetum cinerariifolium]